MVGSAVLPNGRFLQKLGAECPGFCCFCLHEADRVGEEDKKSLASVFPPPARLNPQFSQPKVRRNRSNRLSLYSDRYGTSSTEIMVLRGCRNFSTCNEVLRVSQVSACKFFVKADQLIDFRLKDVILGRYKFTERNLQVFHRRLNSRRLASRMSAAADAIIPAVNPA